MNIKQKSFEEIVEYVNERIDDLEEDNFSSVDWDGDAACELEQMLRWLGKPRERERTHKHRWEPLARDGYKRRRPA